MTKRLVTHRHPTLKPTNYEKENLETQSKSANGKHKVISFRTGTRGSRVSQWANCDYTHIDSLN